MYNRKISQSFQVHVAILMAFEVCHKMFCSLAHMPMRRWDLGVSTQMDDYNHPLFDDYCSQSIEWCLHTGIS